MIGSTVSRHPFRWGLFVILIALMTGCQATGRFRGGRDAVFDAAITSVPSTVGGMRLSDSDRSVGTFKGVLVDGFGNVYLRGRVVGPDPDSPDLTVVKVNAWSWDIRTLFLFPLDAKRAERQFLQAVAERLSRNSHAIGVSTSRVAAISAAPDGGGLRDGPMSLT